MGKKRIAETATEEVLKESDKRQALLDKQKGSSKKKSRILPLVNIYIKASYNNTMISVANEKGDILAWSTSGVAGFRGPKKATPYAASRVVELVMEKLAKSDIREASILVSGIGSGRDAAIRALMGKGLNITSIKDITPLPHNGCRPRKPRRV